jgi:hypothetical protein
MCIPVPRVPMAALLFASALLFFFCARTGLAQPGNGNLYLSFSNLQLDMDKFNDRLIGRGLIELEKSYNSLGGGFFSQFNERWSVGGDIHFLTENRRRAGVYELAVTGTSGGLNLGYVAHRWHGVNIRPKLAVGAGVVNLDISALSPGSSTSPLGDGRGTIEMSSLQATVGLMLSLDYLWVMRNTEGGTGYGLLLGTSIGFQLSPWQGSWESTGVDIFDEPGIKFQGPLIRFSAGFGWKRD